MKINKIRPKCHFLTVIEIKMTYLVVFLFLTVSSPLKPFGSCFIDVYNLELYRTVRDRSIVITTQNSNS